MAKDLLVVLDENEKLKAKLQAARVEVSEVKEQLASAEAELQRARRDVAAAQANEEKSRRLTDTATEKLTTLKTRHDELVTALDHSNTKRNEFRRLLKEAHDALATVTKERNILRDRVETYEQAAKAGKLSGVSASYMRVPGER